jgi:hypothetical protein
MEEKESHLAGSGAHENERTAKKKKKTSFFTSRDVQARPADPLIPHAQEERLTWVRGCSLALI